MKLKQRLYLIIPLFLMSIVAIIINIKFNYYGLFINLATELIGIIITILYVDKILENHEKRNWDCVSKKMKVELCFSCNAIISSLRSAIGYSHSDLVSPSNMFFTAKKEAVDQTLEIIDGYRRNILPNFAKHVSKITKNDWDTLIKNLSNVHNACINYQSMYNAIAKPSQVETMMNVTSLTFGMIMQYQTFFDVISEDDEVLFRQTGSDERIQYKYWLHQSFCNDFDKLVNILYDEIINL